MRLELTTGTPTLSTSGNEQQQQREERSFQTATRHLQTTLNLSNAMGSVQREESQVAHDGGEQIKPLPVPSPLRALTYGGPSPPNLPAKSPTGNANIPLAYWEESQRVNQPPNMDIPRMHTVDNRMQLFIGNLPFRVRWQDVKDLFRKCGTVLRADVALTPENRSKGFGTVLFAHEIDAFRAIEVYNGYNWQGRVLDIRPDLQDPTGGIAMALASAPQLAPQNVQHGWPNAMHFAPLLPPNATGNSLGRTSTPPNANYAGLSIGNSISRPTSSSSVRLNRIVSEQQPNQQATSTSSSEEINRSEHNTSRMSNDMQSVGQQLQSMHQPSFQQQPMFMQQGPMYPAPYGYPSMNGGPINGGTMGYYQVHSMPPRHNVPPGYSNRHLFVGNLPFNTQWQDLKDLFRSAGNILRADVNVGPDGRSRGFGSVLFATPDDAMRAADMFNGFDFNGRILKVHFDKFSQNQAQMPPQQQSMPLQFGSSQAQSRLREYQPTATPEASDNSSMASTHDRSSTNASVPSESDRKTPELKSKAPSDHMVTPGANTNSYSMHLLNHGRHGPGPLFFSQQQQGFSTGPAALMSPQIGDGQGNMFNPLSPQTGRLTMTPSMPGFSFHPFPQTPPLMPHFLSPGIGPFSPPVSQSNYNPAPGAPLRFQHTVHSPGTPGFSSMMGAGYFPPQMRQFQPFEAPMLSDVLAMNELQQSKEGDKPTTPKKTETTQAEPASSTSPRPSDSDQSYFPPVSNLLNRRASTSGSKASPKLGLVNNESSSTTRSASVSATKATFDSNNDVSSRLADLSIRHASETLKDEPPLPSPRRASMFPDSGEAAVAKKSYAAHLQPGLGATSSRRASFEAGRTAQNSKIEFGKSIWS